MSVEAGTGHESAAPSSQPITLETLAARLQKISLELTETRTGLNQTYQHVEHHAKALESITQLQQQQMNLLQGQMTRAFVHMPTSSAPASAPAPASASAATAATTVPTAAATAARHRLGVQMQSSPIQNPSSQQNPSNTFANFQFTTPSSNTAPPSAAHYSSTQATTAPIPATQPWAPPTSYGQNPYNQYPYPNDYSPPQGSFRQSSYPQYGYNAYGVERPKPMSLIPPMYFHDGDHFITFKNKFLAAARFNGWSDIHSRLALTNAMRDDAAEVVADLTAEQFQNLEQMFAEFQDRFLPPAQSQKARMDLDRVYQRHDEPIHLYHARVRRLFHLAYPDRSGSQSELIRRFMWGIKNPQVKEWTCRKNPLTYSEALNVARTELSVVEMHVSSRHGRPSQDNWESYSGGSFRGGPLARQRRLRQERESNSSMGLRAIAAEDTYRVGAASGKPQGSDSDSRCYYCNKAGHFKKECRTFTRALRSFKNRNQASGSGSKGQGSRFSDRPQYKGARPKVAALEMQVPEDHEVVNFEDLGLTEEDWEDPRLASMGEDERQQFFEYFLEEFDANAADEEQDF